MEQLQLLAAYSIPGIPKVSTDNAMGSIIGGVLALGGVLCIVFIIISSIQYIISMGDASKIKKAKDGILYSVVGLVTMAVAFFAVQFTIGIFK